MKIFILAFLMLNIQFTNIVLAQDEQATVIEAPPCLLLSSCLEMVQTVNQDSEGRPCPGTLLEPDPATTYKLVSVAVTEVPEHVRGPIVPEREPVKWWKLIVFAVGIAPVEFFISTALHEGSHVLAAALSGAEITSFKPYPHIENDTLYFGSMSYNGSLTNGQQIALSAAPMITDTVILGLYGGLVLSDNIPRNPYVKVGMWMFAAGHWVDLANHMVSRNEFTDSARIRANLRENYGFSNVEAQLATRGTQALVMGVSGYFLYRGMRDIIESNRAPTRPRKPANMSTWERHELSIAPMGTGKDGTLGLSFSGRF